MTIIIIIIIIIIEWITCNVYFNEPPYGGEEKKLGFQPTTETFCQNVIIIECYKDKYLNITQCFSGW